MNFYSAENNECCFFLFFHSLWKLRFSRDPVVISQTPAINSWSGRNPTESLGSQPPPVAERDSESSIGVSITVNFNISDVSLNCMQGVAGGVAGLMFKQVYIFSFL